MSKFKLSEWADKMWFKARAVSDKDDMHKPEIARAAFVEGFKKTIEVAEAWVKERNPDENKDGYLSSEEFNILTRLIDHFKECAGR